MTTSQNGWAVDRDGSEQDHNPIVPGVSVPNGVRKGDVAVVLRYVARRFDAEVEPLRAGWCWGWYVKVIEGSATISNHASGTAIDLNAPDHPMGAAGTFTAAQRQAIARILDDCDGVVRWGGSYSGRKDEMHWEIVKGAAAVAALAKKIEEDDMPTLAEVETLLKKYVGDVVTRYDAEGKVIDTGDAAADHMWVATGVGYAARDVAEVKAKVRDMEATLERIEATVAAIAAAP